MRTFLVLASGIILAGANIVAEATFHPSWLGGNDVLTYLVGTAIDPLTWLTAFVVAYVLRQNPGICGCLLRCSSSEPSQLPSPSRCDRASH